MVSGNAVGADQTAQQACVRAGGSVICFLADELQRHAPQPGSRVLMVSEDGFDLPFSTARAYRRNRLIHSMAEKSFVAQCALGSGGTWQGTTENLRRGWSDVFVCDDGSEAARALSARGATLLRSTQLRSLSDAIADQCSLFSTPEEPC